MRICWHASTPLVRRILVCAVLAALGLVTFAGTASARATHGTFYFQETIGPVPDVSLCTGLTGINTNTVTDAGSYVDTGTTSHVVGTTTQDYRTDWSDGSYSINHSPAHWEFNTNSTGQVVYTWAQQDRGTVYNADGQVIGQFSVFTLNHVTWRDANGNGLADPDEISSSVEQFRVTC